jgi:hypothetical protein
MLSPGEAVIPAKFVEKYGPLIQGMVAGNIPGYRKGRDAIGSGSSGRIGKSGASIVRPYKENVSSVGGLVGFQQIDPTNIADVTSIYAKEILSSAKISLSSINKEILNWERTNSAAIKIATQAVNEGTSSTEAFAGLMNKFDKDMELAQGPFSKFSKTAQQMLPELQKDLIEAQAKAKELSLNIKKSADATRLAQELPNNIVAQSAAKPGPFSSMRRVRAGAAAKFGGVSGMSEYGIPRFMVDPNTAPSSRAYGLSTSQEHFSTTQSQQANLEAQKILRKQSKENVRVAVGAAQQEAQVASPSKKTIKIGQDIARGLEVGMADRQDDVAKAGSNLSNAAVGGTQRGRRIATRPQGAPISEVAANAPMSPQINAKVKEQARNIKLSSDRLAGLNSKIMGGTFALTSLAGVASMAGGNLGKLSGIVFQLSGVMFALSTVLQILPGRFKTFLLSIKPGPLLLFTAALAAGAGIIKLVNDAREKERMAIEGVGRAANLTSKQIEKLGGVLGFTPVKSNLEFAKPQVSGLSPQRSQQVEELRKMLQDDKDFKDQVKGLGSATKEQADIIFKSLSVRLAGQGATTEAIQNYIYALQQEAGRLDVSFNVNSIDLKSKEGQAGLKDAASKLVNDVNFAFAKGYKTTKKQSMATGQIIEIGEASDELKQKLFSASQVFSSFFMGIETQLATGKINADQFTQSFNQISNSIRQMPKAQGMMILSEMLKTMPSEIAKAAANIKDMDTQFRVLEATMLGVYITEGMLNTLLSDSTDGGKERAEGRVNRYLNEQIAKAKKLKETIAKITQTDPYKDVGSSETSEQKTDKRLSVITNFFNAQEALIKQNRKSQADLYQAQIDTAQGAVDAAQKRIDAEQSVIDINQRQVDLLSRRIELEYDRPIQKLQDESTILGNNLEIIRKQEDAINNQYDKQVQALEKISSINQEIAGQEKSRLTIADALTSGDIAAAAAAVQDARAQAAASRIDQQKVALDASRQQALGGVTAGGMTKDQIEARTYQISQQTFLLEQQKKTLQSQITVLQDKNYTLEQGIYSIKQSSLIPAQALIDKAKLALDEYNKQTDSIVNGVKYLGKTQTEWDNVKVRVEAANSAIDLTELGLKKASALTSQIFKDWDAIKSKVITITTNYVTGSSAALTNPKTTTKMYGGKIFPMAMGGMVPKYMASGGKMGSDTVPAMLTPGEFVMNKKATKSFGPLLSMLNESKYPSMIGSSYDGKGGNSSMITSVNDNSSSVYNYNVGITVPQSNANPNDIARAVMGQIKYIDNQRIRGQR